MMESLISIATFGSSIALYSIFQNTCLNRKHEPQGKVNFKDIVKALGVIPHPEGGYFIETYRSGSIPMSSNGLTDLSGTIMTTDRVGSDRNHMTSMIFMATPDASILYFGVNESDHVHYYHGGDSYTYIVIHPDGKIEEIILGGNVLKNEKLQIVFKKGCFKAGYLKGTYCIIGEGVAPGFDFRDFSFVDEDALRQRLKDQPQEIEKYIQYIKPDRRRNFDDYYDKK